MTPLTVDKIQVLELDITTYCNAACPQCARTDIATGLKSSELVEQHWNMDRIINSLELDKMDNLKLVGIIGIYGDGLMHPDLDKFVDVIINHHANPILFLNTNGGIRSKAWWNELGKRTKDKRFYVFF